MHDMNNLIFPVSNLKFNSLYKECTIFLVYFEKNSMIFHELEERRSIFIIIRFEDIIFLFNILQCCQYALYKIR